MISASWKGCSLINSMGLTSAQYDEIMRTYERERINNEHIHDERMNEVYLKIPEYKALEDEIRNTATELGKRAILGDKNALFEMRETVDKLEERKQRLLIGGGFSSDYVMPVYTCRDCRDKGYINGNKCHCLKMRILKSLYSQSNIESVLEKENFDTFTFDYYNDNELEQMKGILSMCKDFVKTFDKEYSNLIFIGKPGVGKTFLTNCIAKSLLDSEHSVIYFTSIHLFDTLSKYTFDYNSSDEITETREDIINCDLLIIDDLGTEFSNNFTDTQLFFILNERDFRNKSTIISTNLSLSDLSNRFTERVLSRIIGNYRFISPDIDDIRHKLRNF